MAWCRTCLNSRRRSAAGQDRPWCANKHAEFGERIGFNAMTCRPPGSARSFAGGFVNILLLSMPDSFEHMPPIAVRMPNGALTSLAGNVDAQHRVTVADLILVQNRVRETVRELVMKCKPDVVGLSVMTFQRKTALRIIELIRTQKPHVHLAVGGYDPSLAPDPYMEPGAGIDFIIRGEGDITFRELVRALDEKTSFHQITGLSYKAAGSWRHNADRSVHTLDDGEI